MHKRVTKPNPQAHRQTADTRLNTHRSARPATIESLEPRLLLSASISDPIISQDDFAEYLDSVGLGGLEQMDIQVTLDIPDNYTTASQTSASQSEQVAALGEAGLVAVGTQPVGALTGKIVYVHGGHGRFDNGSGWFWQRPLLLEVNEDMSNQDMMSHLVKFLWNAGATVVPLRPVGNQVNEIILDNDDTEVTFVGSWSNSSSTVFYGSPGDTPYRFASTNATETAYARYRPNVTEEGFYPVYSWTRSGSDRVNQLYRVTHSGGTTEVSVNHKRVGNGLVYLGTFHFEAGTDGYVDISNRNSESGVVIADMIRFGNGIGDINLGHGTSGLPREDEAGVYWIAQNLGQGISTSEYGGNSATVSAPPRFAEFMNREADGSLSDRVFISYHSNAGSGSNRGTLGLVNGNNNPSTATPNQFLLANTVAGEVNDDLVGLNGVFEHNWSNRSVHTLDRSDIEFGEINNTYINNEFDATIIEWAFHDNVTDTQLMRDPKVRDAVGLATYQGLQKYFNSVDGGATGLTFLPDAVSSTKAETNGDGNVTVSWTPPPASITGSSAPTGYMVYTSLNGYGFDGGTFVAGGAATSFVMTGLDSANGTHYFKVAAVNAGGQSLDSVVVAATPLPTPAAAKVLIVNGFDRNDRNTNERYTVPGGTIDRNRLRYNNTRDYAVQVGEAVEAFNPALAIDTAQNDNVINGDVLLSDYETVIWILGEESSGDDTFNVTEQAMVSSFINGGGDIFVTGSEIGWDLDNLNNGRSFYNGTLGGDYVSDDAGTYNVTGAAGSVFAGLSFSFDNGTQFYNTDFPDVINPTGGSVAALNYVGGLGGGAGIQKKGSTTGDVVMFGFPFETITSAADRAAVMTAVMNFFGAPPSENPTAPSGLVTTAGDDTVFINWNDNIEPDLLGYDIQRATSPGGPFTTLNGATLLVSEFTDNTAVNGMTYYYRAIAIDTDTNESAPSTAVPATPDDHGNIKNDATPVALPSITDGQMGLVDVDWFEVSLNASTDYTFSVLDAGLGNAQIRLYTSGLTLLASDTGPAAGGTLAEINFFSAVGDSYFIEIIGGGSSGDYQLAVQETDDHGNTTGEATDLFGALDFGSIEADGDIDYFRIPGIAGMQYTFKVQDLGIPDATLTLYDAGGSIITQDSGSTPFGTHAQIVWAAPTSGFIFLSVEALPGSIGDYLVSVESTTAITGDLDGDGFVGINDLNIVLGSWNQSVPPGDPLADPSGDGFVGIDDLNIVLGNWNAGTPPVAETGSDPEEASTANASSNQAPAQQQERLSREEPANTEQANGLAIANWQSREHSAFGGSDDDRYTPAIGLWESDGDESLI